jgi:hypothetical protein
MAMALRGPSPSLSDPFWGSWTGQAGNADTGQHLQHNFESRYRAVRLNPWENAM